MMKKYVLAILGVICLFSGSAFAAGGGAPLPEQDWAFKGMLGQYDKAAMQRGLKVYREVCAGCHSLKRVYYRNLDALGYNENEIKAIAAEYTVEDGPNDEGEMFERSAKPSDNFVSPYPNDAAAKYANNGALPPDLSLITKARKNGANYVHALLIGYEDAPHGHALMDGQYWNEYMPGHVIAMAPPLSDGMVSYEDGTPELLEQYAHDIVNFLTYAADPYMEARKRTGIKAILFLLVFAGVMFALKKKVWKDTK
jgi:ubiquinol-cytochrome c reductase cytochrome c1 subunit